LAAIDRPLAWTAGVRSTLERTCNGAESHSLLCLWLRMAGRHPRAKGNILNISMKAGLLAAGLGLAMTATSAKATVVEMGFWGNSINYCQAFTPGPTNTIRNRVLGAENVGSATINVACDFHWMYNQGVTDSNPTDLWVYFSNNNTSGTITVTCTLLTSYQSNGGYIVPHTTIAIPAGGATQKSLHWTPADNPVGGSTDLGDTLIGINCALPPGGVINDTYLYWQMDNGVGS
jgi:hypothetical protein